MKGIKTELLGIATILLGIAVTTNNFFGYILGFLGFGVAVAGSFKNSILINCTTTYQKISSPSGLYYPIFLTVCPQVLWFSSVYSPAHLPDSHRYPA